MGSEDLAEMVEEGDLDDKLDDEAAIKVVDDVLASTLATNTCTALYLAKEGSNHKSFQRQHPLKCKDRSKINEYDPLTLTCLQAR